MRPTFSEFSYGFALTNELIEAAGMAITAAPIFPSLTAEGRAGGGWDLRLDRPSVPLYLQFKLCDKMKRRNCREARDAGFGVPCYRMHLRSARVSRQHEMLLDLEKKGQEVYYCAPMFHRVDELNNAFLSRSVRNQSIWIRPSEIGSLPDNEEHHVSFEPHSPWTFFSEPKRIESKREFKDVADGLHKRLKEPRELVLRRERLDDFTKLVAEIVEKHVETDPAKQSNIQEALRTVRPIERVAYYASVYLDSQLYIVQEKESS